MMETRRVFAFEFWGLATMLEVAMDELKRQMQKLEKMVHRNEIKSQTRHLGVMRLWSSMEESIRRLQESLKQLKQTFEDSHAEETEMHNEYNKTLGIMQATLITFDARINRLEGQPPPAV